ncbi:hypothetical protein GALL_229500 [mine drainage metagenome]|uniref:Uncharacterized protein n=1 Tax=mine drainage metagenome TaxID=410659 RepID=A0A1J5RHW5_9ZZZZ
MRRSERDFGGTELKLCHLRYFIAVADSIFQVSTRTESAKPPDEQLVLQYGQDVSQGASRHGSTGKSTKALSCAGRQLFNGSS